MNAPEMKQNSALIGGGIVAVALAAIFARPAISQVGSLPAYVKLQTSSPGIIQTGHVNVSGIVKAAQFKGIGAGLTDIDGTNITQGTIDDSVLSPNVANRAEPNNFLVGPNSFYNSDGADGTMALYAECASLSGTSVTGKFVNKSTFGTALQADAQSSTGLTLAGVFNATSNQGVGIKSTGGLKAFDGLAREVNGIAVFGKASEASSSSVGVWGVSHGVTGRGVVGQAVSQSGDAIGGYFQSSSVNGTGVYGEALSNSGFASWGGKFVAHGSNSFGIRASNDTGQAGNFVSGSGTAISATSSSGIGASITGGDFGVTAYTEGPNSVGGKFATTSGNFGVQGENSSPAWYAVYGHSIASSGTGVGVLGQTDSPNGWGLYAFGRSGGTGTKSFRIDHPLDPENKYLYHYSSESPEPINFYSGTVVTDAKGEAWVTLPDYFASINKDFRYTLTVVDDTDSSTFVQVKVAKKIQGNRFKIRSSAGNTEVSWRVDARRNDLFVQRYGAPEVSEKTGNSQGKYQHPELYGKPKEKAEWYVPSRSSSRKQGP